MDEEKKDEPINSEEPTLFNKEGQTGQGSEKVIITRDDLNKTLRKLRRPPGLQGDYKKPKIFSEKPPKSFIKKQAQRAQKERETQASLPTSDEKALSEETAVRLEKIKFQKALQDIRGSEKDPIVAEALTITLKLIFYHGFTPEKATNLKMKQVPTLPQDLQSDVTNYIQHLQAPPNSPKDPDSFLFPCYQSKGSNPSIHSKIHNTPEKKLEWFLGRHKCPSPESIRNLGIKYDIATLLRKGIETPEALTENAKKFGLKEKQVKTILGRVKPSDFDKKKIEKHYWNESSFLEKLHSRGGSEEANAAARIFKWVKEKGFHASWGAGSQNGSCYVVKKVRKGYKEEIFHSISLWTNGFVKIEFKQLQISEEDKRLELRQRLNQIPGIQIPENEIYGKPKIELSVLKDKGALEQFLAAIDWIMMEQGRGT